MIDLEPFPVQSGLVSYGNENQKPDSQDLQNKRITFRSIKGHTPDTPFRGELIQGIKTAYSECSR